MKQIRILSALIVAILLLSSLAHAGAFVPTTLSYQGSLSNIDGTPYSGAKGMTFSLYTVATGGTAIWTETQSSVTVANGRFATVLGTTSTLSASSFSADIWLGIKITGEANEMSPRQKLTSVAFSFNSVNADNGVPVGGIIMWSGAITSIPSGWALCNGATGTPDLRDRFVMGAGSTYAVAASGGATTHTLTIPELPAHNHAQTNYKMLLFNGLKTVSGDDSSTYEPNLQDSGNNPASNGGGQAHSILNPYYALAYIMRTR